jgi:hypothetical protein
MTELIHPLTAECYDAGDLDALIGALKDCDEQIRTLCAFRATVARLVAEQAEPPEDVLFVRTTRLATESHRVKLVWPSPRFSQEALRTTWETWPAIAKNYLAISGLRVRLTEFKKLVGTTSGTKVFREFRCALLAARLMGELDKGAPRIIVEDGPKASFNPDDGLDFADGADLAF